MIFQDTHVDKLRVGNEQKKKGCVGTGKNGAHADIQ
jgi:hypothetical protein